MPLRLAGEDGEGATTRVLSLREEEQQFEFTGIEGQPVPSLLRDFSAPVIIRYPYSRDELAFLMAHDRDPFNRWEAAQRLASELLLEHLETGSDDFTGEERFTGACRSVLHDDSADDALCSLMLTLPAENYLTEQLEEVDPVAVHRIRKGLRRHLAEALADDWQRIYAESRRQDGYRITPEAIGRRSLRNLALGYVGLRENARVAELVMQHYREADNMTDTMAALAVLVNSDSALREAALDDFAQRWQHDPLVMDKWFTVQALASREQVLDEVVALLEHPSFSLRNPNKVRALIGAFAHANPAAFHRADGRGYRFIAEQILLLDRLNPQVAARLATSFTRWRRYDEPRQALMRGELERIAGSEKISEDVFEIVHKSLKG